MTHLNHFEERVLKINLKIKGIFQRQPSLKVKNKKIPATLKQLLKQLFKTF